MLLTASARRGRHGPISLGPSACAAMSSNVARAGSRNSRNPARSVVTQGRPVTAASNSSRPGLVGVHAPSADQTLQHRQRGDALGRVGRGQLEDLRVDRARERDGHGDRRAHGGQLGHETFAQRQHRSLRDLVRALLGTGRERRDRRRVQHARGLALCDEPGHEGADSVVHAVQVHREQVVPLRRRSLPEQPDVFDAGVAGHAAARARPARTRPRRAVRPRRSR